MVSIPGDIKKMCLCRSQIWFSDGLGSVGLMFGLMILEILSNLKDSMILCLL